MYTSKYINHLLGTYSFSSWHLQVWYYPVPRNVFDMYMSVEVRVQGTNPVHKNAESLLQSSTRQTHTGTQCKFVNCLIIDLVWFICCFTSLLKMFQLHSDVTAHICAGGLQKNIDLLLGSYTIPHKHLVGFLQNMEIAL